MMRTSSVLLVALGAASVTGSDLAWRVTELVSVSSTGEQANGWSYSLSVSPDGRFVAFSSSGSNLVPDDTNGFYDVFVRDRHLGTTERVSLTHLGGEANGGSYSPAITPDGRFVAFASGASNLVPGDTNRRTDVFVRDRTLGITERVSVSSGGAQANEESGWLRSISADGRFVAFASKANNLVVPDTNGYFSDVYVRDRLLGITERVNVKTSGIQGNDSAAQPSMSEDGRYVAFASAASNLVEGITITSTQVYVRDRWLGTTELASLTWLGRVPNGGSDNPTISRDGRFVAFRGYASDLVSGDTNGRPDVFVRDRLLGLTERVSVSSAGTQGNNSSGSGIYAPSISDDGRFVAFDSEASNLAPHDANNAVDIFLRDRLLGTTQRVNEPTSGAQPNAAAYGAQVIADGSLVFFESSASNLLPGDLNQTSDVFASSPVEEPKATVSGRVRFTRLSPDASPPTSVTMRITPATAAPYELEVPLGEDGAFLLVMAPRPYELSIRHTHWLRKNIQVDLTKGDAPGSDFILVNGDAQQDNRVSLPDLHVVLYYFGRRYPSVDLDENGVVDIEDVSIVLPSFGMVGDP